MRATCAAIPASKSTGIELAGQPCLLASAAFATEGEFVVDVLGGDSGGVELRGVVEAEPLEHLLVFVVAGVGEDLSEVRVSPGAAAVLWRAGSRRGDQEGGVRLEVRVVKGFHEGVVPPG